MATKAPFAFLLVGLALFEPVSLAWAKKDKVEVTLTAPAAGALYHAPAAITLSAIARAKQKSHPIVKVQFFQGRKLIGTVRSPRAHNQYTFNWANVAAGSYLVMAKATNDKGDTDLSEPVSITVNALPNVAITAPANNAVLAAPATFTVTANASDGDGSIAKVEFYNRATLIGTATSAPYSVTLSDAAAGVLNLRATAIDNRGASSTSAPVTVIVNSLPSVSLTSPTSNASFKAPANIPLMVQVADTDGSIARVEFFHGTTLITALSAPPYSFGWTEVPQGTYALTARVTDNLGGSVTSSLVNVTVNAAEAKLYYIHTDHLDTPREIYNQAQQLVWRRQHQEPFSDSPPDENPSGLGVFEFPLRESIYYGDKETGMQYAMFRDCYDPATGRFCESDPIGLRGGIKPYLYVGANPLSWTDPFGLKAVQCRKPLDSMGGTGTRSGPDIWGNPAYHQYSCVIDANGQITCGGQDRTGSALGSPGKPSKDTYDPQRCEPTYDNKCFDDCLKNEWKKPRPKYGIPFGTDCQEYDDDVNSRCRKKCGLK
ncbi:MAG TPA: Ig-like domain-containing protein [Burkholderiales bacterium]|nr:Ig-like domain-containing protein [Burkholderiales bacterium]